LAYRPESSVEYIQVRHTLAAANSLSTLDSRGSGIGSISIPGNLASNAERMYLDRPRSLPSCRQEDGEGRIVHDPHRDAALPIR
jgi:hypothetical protein